MHENQLLRYSRHILLDEIDIDGQKKLLKATAMVIGCGGLGNACIPILAAAGIGHLILCDHDLIEESNLQRQLTFTPKDLQQAKVDVLADYLHLRNSDLSLRTINKPITPSLLDKYLPLCDVIVDCTDNSKTRQLINSAAFQHKVPLISASVIQFTGQLMVFDSRKENSPCYACLFPQHQDDKSCVRNGVFSALVHVIGAAQAAEVMKLLIGFGEPSVGKIIQFEGINFSTYELSLEKNLKCPTCSNPSFKSHRLGLYN